MVPMISLVCGMFSFIIPLSSVNLSSLARQLRLIACCHYGKRGRNDSRRLGTHFFLFVSSSDEFKFTLSISPLPNKKTSRSVICLTRLDNQVAFVTPVTRG